jgi:YD repeat-containing protein
VGKFRLLAQGTTSGLTTYNYDAVGNLQNFAYPSGVTHAYAYDALNRLTQLCAGTAATGCTGGQLLASYAYTLGAAGNRLTVAELSGRTVAYAYDSPYRLTTETVSADPNNKNGAIGYTYDSMKAKTTIRLVCTSTCMRVPARQIESTRLDTTSNSAH